jgi:hypothetical protein
MLLCLLAKDWIVSGFTYDETTRRSGGLAAIGLYDDIRNRGEAAAPTLY